LNFVDPLAHQWAAHQTRRSFFAKSAHAVGLAALGSLLNPDLFGKSSDPLESRGMLKQLHFPAKAKHVIYLHQSGAPSHIDLFDYKPGMKQHEGLELPASVRMGQRITGMTSGQKAFPVAASQWDWKQHGQSSLWMSDLLPHHGKI